MTAAVLASAVLAAPGPAAAFGERSLDLYFTHTGEKLKITYKRNGRYIPSALKELNRFLRDWRRNESIDMDPELFDLLWEIQNEVGRGKTIHVVSAYRSPATNNMLRSRSRGVAKFSQHMAGKATDFYIPGVSTADIRKAAFKKQIGGVGYYPTSRTPFVHLDTGSVRSWPRMTRTQLLALFPDGKTVHLPSDGKPLQGYEVAKAELEARDRRGRTQVASSSGGGLGGLFGGGDRRRSAPERPEAGSGKNIITALLSRDDDDVEDSVERQLSAEERARPVRQTSSNLPGVNLTAPTNDKPKPAATAAPATAKAEPEAAPSAPPPLPATRPEVAAPADAATPDAPDAPIAPAVPKAAPEPAAEPTPEAVLVAALPKPRPADVITLASATQAAPVEETAPATPDAPVVGGTAADAEAAVASLRASLSAGSNGSDDVPVFGYADGSVDPETGDNVLTATAALVGESGDAPSLSTDTTTVATETIGTDLSPTVDPTATFFGPPDRSDSRFLVGGTSMRTMEFAWLSHPHQGKVGMITAARAPMGGSGALGDRVDGWRTDRFEGVPHVYITQAYATQ
ncbi:DUF882 domain-containing protein [Amorphus orientalis]|uniref:Murein endopeptidase K n=1 Tax=Amorphus orientalis TaxID=649198 RepID=A0AAE3VRD5_9HYPH|nr:DUF882 domain-containing protein [Amorphus orientalis]MDQ0316805.1 uncharacterized protein YcbK (DUF882 family) [Amorphus orientalis]